MGYVSQLKPYPFRVVISYLCSKAVLELGATARFLRHHAMRFRTSLAILFATVVAVAVAVDANSERPNSHNI